MSVALLVLALVAPGAAVAAWGPRGTWAARLGLAMALSPLVGGALVALLALLHVPWATAFWAVGAAGAVVAVLGGVRTRPFADGAGPRAAWIAALVGALALGYGYVTSEWWRIASDAWTHQPIVRALLDHGAPPLDPWYAGYKLQYAWLYHAWVAAAVAATHVDAFVFMSWLAVVSFVALTLVAGDLLARLHGPRVGAALSFFLLGLNGALVLTAAALSLRAMLGHGGGAAGAFAGVGVDADHTGVFLRWFGTQTWFGNKFAGATPLSLGLAALVAWLGAVEQRLAGARGGALLVAVCAGAAALAHPVLLLFVGAVCPLTVALCAIGPAERRRAALPLAWAVAWPAALGISPAALYFAGLLAPSAAHVGAPLDLSGPKLLGLVLCTLPALLVGAPMVARWWRGAPAQRVWAALLVAALGFALVLRLPGGWPFFTVDKTSYLLWIPWALVAGGAWAGWIERAPRLVRAIAVVLVLVPATVLSLSARTFDAHVSIRQPWNGFAPLRAGLPRDALLVTPPGDIDTPVFLARDVFDVDKADGLVRGYDPAELATRHALVDTLFRAGRLDPGLAVRLRATGRPVYVVWPNDELPWAARTPGASLRKFETVAQVPTWADALPPRMAYVGFGAVAGLPGAPTLRPGPSAW